MYGSLAGRVALVTGAGAGIGREIASRLAEERCVVAVNDLRPRAVTDTVTLLEAKGAIASGWPGDMTVEREVAALIDGVASAHGRLDILINNVGLFTYGDLADLDTAAWDACMAINVKSAFMCSRAAVPHLRVQGGAIVNLSSGAGKVGGTGAGAYSAAKWAVIGLTRSLASELAPTIRVNAVCPGIIETQMDADYVRLAAAAHGVAPERVEAERLDRIPMARTGTPEDVARAVAFLCSDEASYTTGEALNVSGGMIMH